IRNGMEVRLVETCAGFSKILCGPYANEVTKILQQAAFPEHRAPGTRKKSPGLCSSIESPFDHQIRRERRLGMGSKRRSPGYRRSLGYRFPADRCQRLRASNVSVRPRTPG